MWKWMGLFLRKNHLLRYWSWLSLLNRIGALTYSIAKTASKKIGALIRPMKFLCPKSTIRPCTGYCCHVWAGAPSCYLELLGNLQKTDWSFPLDFLYALTFLCLFFLYLHALQHCIEWIPILKKVTSCPNPQCLIHQIQIQNPILDILVKTSI